MAVITLRRVGITRRLRGITNRLRATTTSRGFINRHRVITSRRHEAITGLIRIAAGTAMVGVGAVGMDATVAIGITTAAATADVITEAVEGVTMAEAVTVNFS